MGRVIDEEAAIEALPSATCGNLEKPEKPQYSEGEAADCNLDCISRQAAIDALIEDKIQTKIYITPTAERDFEVFNGACDRHAKILKELPSAQPEIIRCGQCKYAELADKEDAQDGYTCQFHRGSIWFSGSYCSWAERRTDEG